MILGVFVRDVDSGNAEREPIDDPTGWRVIGAAGTRPSENPLIPIEGGGNTTNKDRTKGDQVSSNSNRQAGMNFMSNAHLEFLEDAEDGSNSVLERTPRPNQYAFEGEGSVAGSSRVSTMTTTSASASSRSRSYPLENSHRLYEQQLDKPLPPPPPSPLLQDKYVTQPPNPITPPRITANLIPKSRHHHHHHPCHSSSQSYRKSGRQDSSSASTSDSTSSSFNNAINYGGINGGKMTEVEKKRYLLQMRVNRARTQMPSHIVLRVFRDPSECVEIEEMLAGLGLNT